MPSRIYIADLQPGYLQRIREAFQFIDLKAKLKFGDTVFMKPNLTFPVFRKGVMTNPECVEALVIALKDYTDRIIVGEADSGGYNRFDINDVLEKTGIKGLEKKYGIRAVNLSQHPNERIRFHYKHRDFEVPMPTMLLHEVDLFITVPVPKIHSNTRVSVSIKNQWGCIPEPAERLKLHPFFEKVIYEVNKSIRAAVSVVDGRYGLNRNGPMLGDAVDLGWLMVADSLTAADVTACHLMQIDPRSVYYLRYIDRHEERLPRVSEIQFNQEYRKFIGPKFYLRKSWTDRLCTVPFRSPFFSYLAYFSPLSDFLHKVLYLFRKPFYDYQSPSETAPDQEGQQAAERHVA